MILELLERVRYLGVNATGQTSVLDDLASTGGLAGHAFTNQI